MQTLPGVLQDLISHGGRTEGRAGLSGLSHSPIPVWFWCSHSEPWEPVAYLPSSLCIHVSELLCCPEDYSGKSPEGLCLLIPRSGNYFPSSLKGPVAGGADLRALFSKTTHQFSTFLISFLVLEVLSSLGQVPWL